MSAILRTITIYQARAVQKSLNRRGKERGKERHPIFKGPVSRLITQFASLFSTVSFHRGAMEGARAPLSHAMVSLTVHPYLFLSLILKVNAIRDSTRDRTSARSVIPATCAL